MVTKRAEGVTDDNNDDIESYPETYEIESVRWNFSSCNKKAQIEIETGFSLRFRTKYGILRSGFVLSSK